MLPGEAPDFNKVTDVNTANAIIAGAGFDTQTYRYGFDFSIPFYSPLLAEYSKPTKDNAERNYFLIAPQLNMFDYHRRMMQEIVLEDSNNNILLLQKCTQEIFDDKISSAPELVDHDIRCTFPGNSPVEYPEILEQGTFCLIIRGVRLAQPTLLEAMATNCIPVIIADNIVLPFQEIIDWTLAAITIREAELHSLATVLKSVSSTKIGEMQRQGRFLFEKYFKNIETIVLAMLDELNDRVFPHLALTYNSWNLPVMPNSAQNPLFLPLMASKGQGFTAVVLTYDRVESLFTLIQKLSLVPSLNKILVIWNNQKKAPPNSSLFPKISKPLKVIQTTSNKLSNRFYPYPEIETEAVLTIDDDITMLTPDELDFGFEVWREFPERIVGFPSRTHVFENHEWKYESEWTNEVSLSQIWSGTSVS
jgi:glucuronyl/N-acetylglucosaminyl transferase EXT2